MSKNDVFPFIRLFLTSLGQKLSDYLLRNPSSKFLEKSTFGPLCFEIDFIIFKQNSIIDSAMKNRRILSLKVLIEALWMGLWLSLEVFIKMIGFIGKMGRWKLSYFSVMKYIGFIILTLSVVNSNFSSRHGLDSEKFSV